MRQKSAPACIDYLYIVYGGGRMQARKMQISGMPEDDLDELIFADEEPYVSQR